MRRLLSSSFRNRLFAAFLAASLIPLLLCSALLLQIFRLRMEDRTQAEADRYLDSAVQALDQACQSLTSAAAALERDAVLSQALLQGSPTQGEVYRLFLEDVQSAQTLARLDYKKVCSRDYPYVRLNGGYGYTLNKYELAANSRRSNLGLNFGVTIGFNLFDGNRRRERRNASLAVENARLEREQLEQTLRADLSNLWQAYRNNLELLKLERQNLIVAKDNYDISRDRYLLGDLAGIEMREAQKNLLDAEERILSAEYDTKICEISLLQISGKITEYLK